MVAWAQIELEGTSPLLMHRFPIVPVEAFSKKTPQEQAEISCYRNPETQELFIPGVAVQRALINAATYSKGKGRASLQKTAAACLLVTPENLSLGIKDYVIDSRATVIPATRGRIITHRPRIDKWRVTLKLEWDQTLLKETEVRRIVEDAGTRVGVLAFRPEKKGPFGRFVVTSWKNGKP